MVKGYKMLKATPKHEAPEESPMITWGKIKGEPVFLGEISSFRIQKTPLREEISMRLTPASLRKRDEKAKDKELLRMAAQTPARESSLSDAGKRLLQRMIREKTPVRKS